MKHTKNDVAKITKSSDVLIEMKVWRSTRNRRRANLQMAGNKENMDQLWTDMFGELSGG